jgi:hypothetical protein
MRDRQRIFLVIVTATVLACTGYVAWARVHPRTLADVVRRPEGAPTTQPFHAIVVFRVEDCGGRVDFMHAFARPRWRQAFYTSAFVVGGEAEVGEAAQRLRARGIAMPVSAVRANAHPGRFLGYTSTPYLLILDRQNRVRLASPDPTRSSEMEAFEHATDGLAASLPQRR